MNNNLIEQAKQKLENISVYLLKKHSFLGYVFLNLNRHVTNNNNMPTACVYFKNNEFNLEVNATFFLSLTLLEAIDIIKHEIFHLLFEHLERTKQFNQQIANVAADFSCNSFLNNLPKKHINSFYIPNKLKKTDIFKKIPKDGMINLALKAEDYNLPEKLTFEQYYDLIISNEDLKKQFTKNSVDVSQMSEEEQDQLAEKIKNGEIRITHGIGQHQELQNNINDIKSEKLRNILENAKKNTNSFGDLPQEIQKTILNVLNPIKNWKNILHSFLQYATLVKQKNSRQKRNRRYGVTYPGVLKNRDLNICLYIDSSGSITQEDIDLFLPEINKIYSDVTKSIRIMVGDTETHNNYVIKNPLNKETFLVNGGGGTDAQSWLNSMSLEKNIDCSVIFSDLYFDFSLQKPKFPVLWAITKNGVDLDYAVKNIPFGKCLKLVG